MATKETDVAVPVTPEVLTEARPWLEAGDKLQREVPEAVSRAMRVQAHRAKQDLDRRMRAYWELEAARLMYWARFGRWPVLRDEVDYPVTG